MSNSKSLFCSFALFWSFLFFVPAACHAAPGDGPVAPATAFSSSSDAALPEAPAPQVAAKPFKERLGGRTLNYLDSGYAGVSGKWDVTINRGEAVHPFTAGEKIHFALREEIDPGSILTASLAAGYEHIRDTDPHFGTDSAGFGERFGAAAFRQGVNRTFGDGVLPALLHEDPRYYRVAQGSIWSRGLGSVEQTVVRHRDDGTLGINYSGLGGHILADGLPITFYPQVSAKADVALKGFGTSLAADAGIKLMREFLPDLFQAMGLVSAR
jgi:hypothetical protein